MIEGYNGVYVKADQEALVEGWALSVGKHNICVPFFAADQGLANALCAVIALLIAKEPFENWPNYLLDIHDRVGGKLIAPETVDEKSVRASQDEFVRRGRKVLTNESAARI